MDAKIKRRSKRFVSRDLGIPENEILIVDDRDIGFRSDGNVGTRRARSFSEQHDNWTWRSANDLSSSPVRPLSATEHPNKEKNNNDEKEKADIASHDDESFSTFQHCHGLKGGINVRHRSCRRTASTSDVVCVISRHGSVTNGFDSLPVKSDVRKKNQSSVLSPPSSFVCGDDAISNSSDFLHRRHTRSSSLDQMTGVQQELIGSHLLHMTSNENSGACNVDKQQLKTEDLSASADYNRRMTRSRCGLNSEPELVNLRNELVHCKLESVKISTPGTTFSQTEKRWHGKPDLKEIHPLPISPEILSIATSDERPSSKNQKPFDNTQFLTPSDVKQYQRRVSCPFIRDDEVDQYGNFRSVSPFGCKKKDRVICEKMIAEDMCSKPVRQISRIFENGKEPQVNAQTHAEFPSRQSSDLVWAIIRDKQRREAARSRNNMRIDEGVVSRASQQIHPERRGSALVASSEADQFISSRSSGLAGTSTLHVNLSSPFLANTSQSLNPQQYKQQQDHENLKQEQQQLYRQDQQNKLQQPNTNSQQDQQHQQPLQQQLEQNQPTGNVNKPRTVCADKSFMILSEKMDNQGSTVCLSRSPSELETRSRDPKKYPIATTNKDLRHLSVPTVNIDQLFHEEVDELSIEYQGVTVQSDTFPRSYKERECLTPSDFTTSSKASLLSTPERRPQSQPVSPTRIMRRKLIKPSLISLGLRSSTSALEGLSESSDTKLQVAKELPLPDVYKSSVRTIQDSLRNHQAVIDEDDDVFDDIVSANQQAIKLTAKDAKNLCIESVVEANLSKRTSVQSKRVTCDKQIKNRDNYYNNNTLSNQESTSLATTIVPSFTPMKTTMNAETIHQENYASEDQNLSSCAAVRQILVKKTTSRDQGSIRDSETTRAVAKQDQELLSRNKVSGKDSCPAIEDNIFSNELASEHISNSNIPLSNKDDITVRLKAAMSKFKSDVSQAAVSGIQRNLNPSASLSNQRPSDSDTKTPTKNAPFLTKLMTSPFDFISRSMDRTTSTKHYTTSAGAITNNSNDTSNANSSINNKFTAATQGSSSATLCQTMSVNDQTQQGIKTTQRTSSSFNERPKEDTEMSSILRAVDNTDKTGFEQICHNNSGIVDTITSRVNRCLNFRDIVQIESPYSAIIRHDITVTSIPSDHQKQPQRSAGGNDAGRRDSMSNVIRTDKITDDVNCNRITPTISIPVVVADRRRLSSASSTTSATITEKFSDSPVPNTGPASVALSSSQYLSATSSTSLVLSGCSRPPSSVESYPVAGKISCSSNIISASASASTATTASSEVSLSNFAKGAPVFNSFVSEAPNLNLNFDVNRSLQARFIHSDSYAHSPQLLDFVPSSLAQSGDVLLNRDSANNYSTRNPVTHNRPNMMNSHVDNIKTNDNVTVTTKDYNTKNEQRDNNDAKNENLRRTHKANINAELVPTSRRSKISLCSDRMTATQLSQRPLTASATNTDVSSISQALNRDFAEISSSIDRALSSVRSDVNDTAIRALVTRRKNSAICHVNKQLTSQLIDDVAISGQPSDGSITADLDDAINLLSVLVNTNTEDGVSASRASLHNPFRHDRHGSIATVAPRSGGSSQKTNVTLPLSSLKLLQLLQRGEKKDQKLLRDSALSQNYALSSASRTVLADSVNFDRISHKERLTAETWPKHGQDDPFRRSADRRGSSADYGLASTSDYLNKNWDRQRNYELRGGFLPPLSAAVTADVNYRCKSQSTQTSQTTTITKPAPTKLKSSSSAMDVLASWRLQNAKESLERIVNYNTSSTLPMADGTKIGQPTAPVAKQPSLSDGSVTQMTCAGGSRTGRLLSVTASARVYEVRDGQESGERRRGERKVGRRRTESSSNAIKNPQSGGCVAKFNSALISTESTSSLSSLSSSPSSSSSSTCHMFELPVYHQSHDASANPVASSTATESLDNIEFLNNFINNATSVDFQRSLGNSISDRRLDAKNETAIGIRQVPLEVLLAAPLLTTISCDVKQEPTSTQCQLPRVQRITQDDSFDDPCDDSPVIPHKKLLPLPVDSSILRHRKLTNVTVTKQGRVASKSGRGGAGLRNSGRRMAACSESTGSSESSPARTPPPSSDFKTTLRKQSHECGGAEGEGRAKGPPWRRRRKLQRNAELQLKVGILC